MVDFAAPAQELSSPGRTTRVSIRETVVADVEAIYRIRTDPLVRPHQFRIPDHDTPESFRNILFGEQSGPAILKCTTILLHNEVIGHITQSRYSLAGQRICYAGWNIAPAHWGRGYAPQALTQLLDQLFGKQQIDQFIADCFSRNTRCRRLLSRLGFQRGTIGWLERLQTAWRMRCGHWIVRYWISTEVWRHARA